MPKTGCYICNYNGKDYAVKCVESVLSQIEVNENFQLYMVDNASTDKSVECIREVFGRQVRLIQNKENIGGAGGFNTALRDAIDKNYDYVILLDNDIIVDKECIFNFQQYMNLHSDIGCIGAKIMIMDRPNYIQEFGGQLDFEKYDLIKNYWYELERETEEIIKSDWVSSCALIARVEAIKKTKLFPEENFLFWDDIEFTYQIKLAGYQVVSLASAKVYHKGKKKAITNTTAGYYGMRNRIKFFSRYEKEERLSHLCENMLDEYFQIFFGSASKGFHSANNSRMLALDDFVHKHYGRIDDDKVYPMNEKEDKIKQVVENYETVYVELPEEKEPVLFEAIGALCHRLDELKSVKKVIIVLNPFISLNEAKGWLSKYYDYALEIAEYVEEKGVSFMPCRHFKEVKENIIPKIWFDKYLNCVADQEDFERIKAYPYIKEFFIRIHYEWLMRGIREERNRR